MVIGAPSMTMGLATFEGAPSRETGKADSINTSDCWSPSAKTFQSADDTIVSPSLNHSWAPFLIRSTSIIDEIPNKSTKRLRQRRFVSNHGKNGEASRKYSAQSNIEAINESANDTVVVVKCETVPFFEVDSTPLSWFVDLSATNATNAADAASPIWTGRNSIKVKKEASWFDDDLTSINSTNHEVDCFSPEIDNSFNIQKLGDSPIQNTNSKTNYSDGSSDQNVINKGPIRRQKGLIKSILKRAQTSPEVVTDQATPAGRKKSPRLDEDELDGQTRSFKRVKFADGTKAGKSNTRECTDGDVSQIKPTMSTSTQLSLLRRPTLDDVVIKTMTTTQDCTQMSKETSLSVDQMAAERECTKASYSSDNVVFSSVSVDNYLVGCRMPATIVNDSPYPEILSITTATDTQGYIDSINEQSVTESNIIEYRVDAVSTSMIKCYEDITDGVIVESEYDKHRDNESTIGDNDDIFLEEDLLCYSSEVLSPRFQHIIDESTATKSVTGHYRSSVHSTVTPSTSTRNSETYDKSLESSSQQPPVIHAVASIGGTGDRLELKDAPHKVQMPNASHLNSQLADDNDDSKPLKLKSSGSSRGYDRVIDKMHRVFGSSSLEKLRRRKKYEGIIKVEPDEGSLNQAICSKENSRENSTTDLCYQLVDSTEIELTQGDEVVRRQPDDDELSRTLNIITLKDRKMMRNNPNEEITENNDNVNEDNDEGDIEDESTERTTLGCSDLTWDLLNEDEDDEDDSLFEDSPTDFSYHRTMTISNMLRLDDTKTSEDPTKSLRPQADR